jgi:tRNA A-37 threonylcarbamoyl transferase component Bud32
MVRRESTVYRLASARSGKSIAIKIITKPSRAMDDSGSLYAALRHYHARADRERGYTVPEPYGWIPEHHAVIMEWVEARTFNQVLKTDWFFTKRRHAHIRKVAGWLRWFHAQSEIEPGVPVNNKQLKGIVKVFENSSGLESAATAHDPALRNYLQVALKCAGRQRGATMDCATLHGDFKATNILISQTGVVGIDFLGRKRGSVSHDICRFLSDLDFYHAWLGRSFALKPASKANDFEVFLSAYGGAAGGIDRQAFLHMYYVTILSSLVHQRRKFQRHWGQMLRLALIRSIARQLSNALSKGPGLTGAKPD